MAGLRGEPAFRLGVSASHFPRSTSYTIMTISQSKSYAFRPAREGSVVLATKPSKPFPLGCTLMVSSSLISNHDSVDFLFESSCCTRRSCQTKPKAV